MGRLYSPFWVGFTLLLSVVFVVLFYPMVHEKYGLSTAVLLTVVCLVVIWVNYLVRAHIFSQWSKDKSDKRSARDSKR